MPSKGNVGGGERLEDPWSTGSSYLSMYSIRSSASLLLVGSHSNTLEILETVTPERLTFLVSLGVRENPWLK